MALSLYRRVLGQGRIFSSLHSLAAGEAITARRRLCAVSIHPISFTKLSRGSTIVRPYPTSPHLFYPIHVNPQLAKILDNKFHFVNAEFISFNMPFKPFSPVTCLASTRGWLGLLNPDDGSLYLHRPSLDDIRLPATPLIPFMTGGPEHVGFQLFGGMSVRNLVLSGEPDEDSCILMAVLDECNPKLAYCRPGLDGSEWTILHGSKPGGEQLVYSEPRATFYALSACFSGIEAWNFSDTSNPDKSQFVYKSIPLPSELSESEKLLRRNCMNKSYLVVDEPSGDLLLVVKYYDYDMPIPVPVMGKKFGENVYEEVVFKYGAQRYDVYKVDFAGKSLEYLNCLTNRVIFLGFNHSFCLTTDRHPHLIPHTIYFADDIPEEYDHASHPRVKHRAGIYHYSKQRIGPFPPFNPPNPIRGPTFWVAPGSSERPNCMRSTWDCNVDEEMKRKMRKMHME